MRAILERPAGLPVHRGYLRIGGARFPCAIGAAGVTTAKSEGDGATPCGTLPLRRVLYRADRVPPPAASVPREPLGADDGWCDWSSDPAYNRAVRLPHGARTERLWRDDGLYDVIGVLGWNDAPTIAGRGSAIFLHVATADLAPTAGCIALARGDLVALLAGGLDAVDVSAG